MINENNQIKLAVELIKQRDKIKARQILSQILNTNSKNDKAWTYMAYVANSRQEAIFYLNRAIKINPMNSRAHELLNRVERKNISKKKNWFVNLFTKKNILYGLICCTFYIFYINVLLQWNGSESPAQEPAEPLKNIPIVTEKDSVPKTVAEPQKRDWDQISRNLIADYEGMIISVDQLNSATCWAQISFDISELEAIEIAENIGYYIRNSTGGIDGEKPSVHVFQGRTHIAYARPTLDGFYRGHLDIQNW